MTPCILAILVFVLVAAGLSQIWDSSGREEEERQRRREADWAVHPGNPINRKYR